MLNKHHNATFLLLHKPDQEQHERNLHRLASPNLSRPVAQVHVAEAEHEAALVVAVVVVGLRGAVALLGVDLIEVELELGNQENNFVVKQVKERENIKKYYRFWEKVE